MCGIIVSTENVPLNVYKNINKRGPDNTNILFYNNIYFIHFLLHLTGEMTTQPIVDNNLVCIFNGEIYNYKDILPLAKSDSYSIIEAYKKYGEEFVKYLDGEFTIVLFDFNINKLFICSDIFKTKPLFYNIDENGIIISSYESVCKTIRNQNYLSINPNEVIIFDLITRQIDYKYTIYNFNLNQYKLDYNDFFNALERAILKRYPENSIPLITLSSGADSGVIACCLNKYKKNALYFSIPKNEDINIINNRKNILNDSHFIIDLTEEEKTKWKQYLLENCEPFNWDWTYNPNVNFIVNGFDMSSMFGKSKIINSVKEMNKEIKVLISGVGADEVMARNSFYSCGYGNVDIFPDNLDSIFPWANFFKGSMENYLKGDEYVGGCFSFETRYPFCDKDLVQEFLWLLPKLKNEYNGSIYKPPLIAYLDKENFPFHIKKYGFNV